MTIESNPVVSETFVCKPQDSRCKYWAKVIRADQAIPLPEQVSGANDVPGAYIREGDDIELFPGDWLLTGEEVSHNKKRGWCYHLLALGRGEKSDVLNVYAYKFGVDSKPLIRAAGAKDILTGSGDVAAMIREIHARRRGIKPMPRIESREPAVEVAPETVTESL